jgi:hypothetical protein
MRPYLRKNPSQKRAGGVAPGLGLDFKPQWRGWGPGWWSREEISPKESEDKPGVV